jgi:hypothetical protein
LKNVVTVESIEELAHVAASDIPGYAVGSADLLGDARFVISTPEEFEDLGTHQVQAKHLAVVDVQENRAVLRLGAAYVIRDSEHGLMGELAVPVPLPTVAPDGGAIHSNLFLFRKESQAL